MREAVKELMKDSFLKSFKSVLPQTYTFSMPSPPNGKSKKGSKGNAEKLTLKSKVKASTLPKPKQVTHDYWNTSTAGGLVS